LFSSDTTKNRVYEAASIITGYKYKPEVLNDNDIILDHNLFLSRRLVNDTDIALIRHLGDKLDVYYLPARQANQHETVQTKKATAVNITSINTKSVVRFIHSNSRNLTLVKTIPPLAHAIYSPPGADNRCFFTSLFIHQIAPIYPEIVTQLMTCTVSDMAENITTAVTLLLDYVRQSDQVVYTMLSQNYPQGFPAILIPYVCHILRVPVICSAQSTWTPEFFKASA
jgi:hypothetical protein